MIVAVSRNGVIGQDGQLPWRLSADLQRFRQLTWGHHLIMGRKTFVSINRLLPGRTTVVLTRQPDWLVHGAFVVHSVEEVLHLVSTDDQPFVVGGAEIYRELLPWTGRLYVTRVEADVAGDTYLQPLQWDEWTLLSEATFPADERNQFPYTFLHYLRVEAN